MMASLAAKARRPANAKKKPSPERVAAARRKAQRPLKNNDCFTAIPERPALCGSFFYVDDGAGRLGELAG